ncbi:hypothetical protein BH11ARM2_BH11ARM2_04300 [soil metagenome]
MVEMRPFRGLRYAAEAGQIGRLVAPPSDSLDLLAREGYADRSPQNVVRLAAPEGRDDDRSRYVRYARAAADLMAWRREGLLVAEPAPAVYRIRQKVGDLQRTGLIALFRTVVLPTLQAAPVHAHDDRLRLLEATRTYFEVPVAVGTISGLENAAGGNAVTLTTEDGVKTTVEPLYGEEDFHALAVSGLTLVDGAEGWRAAQEFAPDGWAPLAVFPHEGTILMPLFRIVPAMTDAHGFLARLPAEIHVVEHHSSRLYDALVLARREGKRGAAVAFEGGRGYLLLSDTLDPLEAAYAAAGVRDPAALRTTPEHRIAIRLADEGTGAAFLTAPPTMNEALAHAPLPYRSVSAYPHLPSGLVMSSLADEVAR